MACASSSSSWGALALQYSIVLDPVEKVTTGQPPTQGSCSNDVNAVARNTFTGYASSQFSDKGVETADTVVQRLVSAPTGSAPATVSGDGIMAGIDDTDESLDLRDRRVGCITQFQTQLTDYRAVLDLIKKNMKPFPKGMGVFGMTSGMNPQFARLRHLRERKFF